MKPYLPLSPFLLEQNPELSRPSDSLHQGTGRMPDHLHVVACDVHMCASHTRNCMADKLSPILQMRKSRLSSHGKSQRDRKLEPS